MSITDANQQPEDQRYRLFSDLLEQSQANEIPTEGEVIEGTVVAINKGEALIDYGGKAEGIVQGREMVDSSLDETIEVGAEVLAVVLHPEDEEGRAILSIRRARAERKWREMHDKFESKDPVTVTVVQPNKGGLIVNAEGLQGFVPISQLGPEHYPSKIQKGPGFADAAIAFLTQFIGDEFDAQIIEYERETNRLILSERVLLQRTGGFEPLEELDFKEGDEVDGKVVAIKDFGVFVDLGTASGLVHISEMSWDRVNHPGDLVKMGQDVTVKVIGIDEGGRRVSLSMKRLTANPWVRIAKRYKMGQVIKGLVTKIVDYGAFVQLEPGFDGLVHISELSSHHVKDPADVLQEGQEAEFRIILLDHDNQRLGLSFRQAQDGDATPPASEAEPAPAATVPEPEEPAAEEAAPAEEPAAEEPEAEPEPAADTAEEAEPEAEAEPAALDEIVDEAAERERLLELDEVDEEQADALIAGGYTIEKLCKATVSELALVPGIRMASAEKIIQSAKAKTESAE